jgi:protein-disulfide isomerase
VPHCALAHPIVERVRLYFDKKVNFVFRHLSTVHENAENAAESAEFAAAHGRFWEMHDGLYENQDRLDTPLVLALARRLDLPVAELRQALATGQYEAKIRSDFLGGVRSGVNGTPTFFIGKHRHDGSFAYEDLVAAVEAHLRAMAMP